MINTARKISNIPKKNRIKALLIVSWLISLLNTMGFLPVYKEITAAMITNKVVVLIPPAVDNGEPPMNISAVEITEVEVFKVAPTSKVEKPAVLRLTE